jgi:predicted ThiF/HesA family dinucleotide-utilizing enzyme
VYVYGPKYHPAYPDLHISRAKIERLFLIMGKGLEDMNLIRKRKGMAVDEKLVEYAEKQKTLKSQ